MTIVLILTHVAAAAGGGAFVYFYLGKTIKALKAAASAVK